MCFGLFCAVLNSLPPRFVVIVLIVLLVFVGSLSRRIFLVIPGHTSDLFNCCFRNLGGSNCERCGQCLNLELGMFFREFFWYLLMMFLSVFLVCDANLTHLIYHE